MKRLLFIFLVPIVLYGQNWETTYGGSNDDQAYSVQATNDGGYITVGQTDSFGNGDDDIYLIKTNSDGIDNWTQTFGGIGNDYAKCVQQTSDGGYIIVGNTNSFGSGLNDVYLIKTDLNGQEEWNRTFGGIGNDFGYSVQQTIDGGYIITGYTTSFGSGSSDVYLIKTDGNGVEEWNNTFGGTAVDRGYSVEQNSDGGYIITGYTTSFGTGSSDIYLIKTDMNGSPQWNKNFGGGADIERGYSVQQTIDGGYVVAGNVKTVDWDIYLLKTDSNGIEEWNHTFGSSGYDEARSIDITIDGGFIIAGTTTSTIGDNDVYLLKTDSNGIEEWNQSFGGTSNDLGYSVNQTSDGGYIIAGYTNSFGNGGNDIYLIKTNLITTLNVTEYSCGSYTDPNGQIYFSTGNYSVSILNSFGFDSVIMNIDLTIIPLPNNSITQNGSMLIADQVVAGYQWLDCDNGYNVIPNEINQFYIPDLIGNYCVEVSVNGCKDTSDCILVDFTSLTSIQNDIISIYPNPLSNILNISGIDEFISLEYIKIISSAGQEVINLYGTNGQYDVANLEKGIYFLRINSEKGLQTIRFIKI